jgi:hypothetical protein
MGRGNEVGNNSKKESHDTWSQSQQGHADGLATTKAKMVNSPGDDVLSDGLVSAGAMVTTMTKLVLSLYVLGKEYDVTTV